MNHDSIDELVAMMVKIASRPMRIPNAECGGYHRFFLIASLPSAGQVLNDNPGSVFIWLADCDKQALRNSLKTICASMVPLSLRGSRRRFATLSRRDKAKIVDKEPREESGASEVQSL